MKVWITQKNNDKSKCNGNKFTSFWIIFNLHKYSLSAYQDMYANYPLFSHSEYY